MNESPEDIGCYFDNFFRKLSLLENMVDQAHLTVINVISDSEGVDPSDLTPPLEERVDTDAIQRLAAHSGRSWELSFEFADHRVTVSGDGWVSVDGERIERWRSTDKPRDKPTC